MKQETLPGEGMKPKVHRDISEAAEALADAKDEQKKLREKVDELAAQLVARMRKHKLDTYKDRSRGLFVTVEDETKVKVKRGKPGEDVDDLNLQ
jgi:histidinol-phosphate/aromatic aminotransferase/cobyric acid decarboxylase-like protein